MALLHQQQHDNLSPSTAACQRVAIIITVTAVSTIIFSISSQQVRMCGVVVGALPVLCTSLPGLRCGCPPACRAGPPAGQGSLCLPPPPGPALPDRGTSGQAPLQTRALHAIPPDPGPACNPSRHGPCMQSLQTRALLPPLVPSGPCTPASMRPRPPVYPVACPEHRPTPDVPREQAHDARSGPGDHAAAPSPCTTRHAGDSIIAWWCSAVASPPQHR